MEITKADFFICALQKLAIMDVFFIFNRKKTAFGGINTLIKQTLCMINSVL